jgi:hypothetical protein
MGLVQARSSSQAGAAPWLAPAPCALPSDLDQGATKRARRHWGLKKAAAFLASWRRGWWLVDGGGDGAALGAAAR